jgi:hypothetical protein
MEEIWKSLIGYEGLYEISNMGRVKSIKFDKERILKPSITNKGYYIIVLYKDNIRDCKTIHRLVIRTFIGEPKSDEICDHINRIKTDNRIENLRWVTKSKNNLNTVTYGKSKYRGVTFTYYETKGQIKTRIVAQIGINSKPTYLGTFKTEEEAHMAYKEAYLNHYGYEWVD